MTEAPIILRKNGVVIRAYADKFVAHFVYEIKAQVHRTFPEIEDLYALSLRGLISRANEFYNELIQNS